MYLNEIDNRGCLDFRAFVNSLSFLTGFCYSKKKNQGNSILLLVCLKNDSQLINLLKGLTVLRRR